MYKIKLTDYVPEPKPATSDRIVAAHYYGAWKKGAALIHGGFDDLHDFPERTPLMGYYDEENPEVRDWEIKWASEHGINCFIHCWYRLKENAGKPVTVNDLRCGHALHESLFHSRYQNSMKFAIMFENLWRWASTDADDLVNNLMPFWVDNYFSRENYLKIDNKPVLFIFYPPRIKQEFPNPADQKAAFDACREYAKSRGFDGMLFAYSTEMYRYEGDEPLKTVHEDNLARGYDFAFGYAAHYVPSCQLPEQEEIIEGQVSAFKRELEIDPMTMTPTVSCFRDSTPRHSKKWRDMGYTFYTEKRFYATPESFRTILRRIKEMTETLPEDSWARKFIAIDNWNEWDEGHYIAPSHEFGFRYLQAIREELTDRDNLPDYRTPQDIGLSENLNTSWEVPDFAKICAEKFKT